MKNYRKVQAIINGKFDDLMELKKDCEIKTTKSFEFRVDEEFGSKIKIKKGLILSYISHSKLLYVNPHNIKHYLQHWTTDIGEFVDFKVLGQPVTVQSLGRKLGVKYKINLGNGQLERYNRETTQDWHHVLTLDLSKPPQEWGEKKLGEILDILST